MHYSNPPDSRKSTVLRSSFPPTRVSFTLPPLAGEGRGALAQQIPGHSWANSQSVWKRHSLMPFRPFATTACNSRILFCFWVSSVSISVLL